LNHQLVARYRAHRAGQSVIVELQACSAVRALKETGLPQKLMLRFVSVRLKPGELEVLVTSLLSPEAYPTEEFLEVNHWRWNHETYYQILKGRLDLEN
jgi:hypothetical protein